MAGSDFRQWGNSGGGRFFGEIKGVRLSKVAGSEVWSGAGSLGGLLVEIDVMPHELGRKVTITCKMFALECVDTLVKVGPLWSGEYVYVKTGSDGTKWLNLKTSKSLSGVDPQEEW